VRTAVGQFVRKSWEQLLPTVLQSAFSVFWVGLSDQFCYSCLVRYPWREVCHLCLAIKPRVCFRNHSLSRLRCSGVASAYGWVTILLYCLWLNEHIHYFLTGYGPTLSSDSLTAGR
jgi:hypothetical protein